MSNISNEELDALQAWEEAMEFGQEAGECGVCGHGLKGYERESGLCDLCFVDFTESTGENLCFVYAE